MLSKATLVLKIIGSVVLVAAIGYGVWTIKGKFDRAAEADRLQTEVDMAQQELEIANAALDTERDLRQKADEDRVKISGELDAARRDRDKAIKRAVQAIKATVPDNRSCDIPVEVLQELNRARGYQE